MSDLASRRAAALAALSRRRPNHPVLPGETQPSDDIPRDPRQAQRFFDRRYQDFRELEWDDDDGWSYEWDEEGR